MACLNEMNKMPKATAKACPIRLDLAYNQSVVGKENLLGIGEFTRDFAQFPFR
jgi:hypothetical protein